MYSKRRSTSIALAIFLSFLSPSLLAQIPASPALAQSSNSNARREANRLFNLGNQQFDRSQFEQARNTFQQVLELRKQSHDLGGQGDVLLKLGQVYEILGLYEQALASYKQSAEIFSKLGERDNQSGAFSGVGIVYLRIGRYYQAIAAFQQALKILPQAPVALNGLGLAYTYLGQYDKALNFHQQTLAIHRANHNLRGEATSLLNIGSVYSQRSQYPEALNSFQQALEIYRQANNPTGQVRSLNLIGEIYNLQNQSSKALSFFQDALKLSKTINDRRGQGIAFNNIGRTYFNLQQYSQAVKSYEQALAIRREIGDREGEGETLGKLGELVAKQNQSELAIVFLKQSVNTYESIRHDLQQLPADQQESYTRTVAGTYRRLADLLLSQGRVLEAQQVLELLKIQELRSYTRNARAGGQTQGSPLTPPEASVISPFNNTIAMGLKLSQCEQQKPYCSDRDQLLAQRNAANTDFEEQLDKLRALAKQQLGKDPAQLQQQELTIAAQNVVKAQPKTVLIYPLVLEDNLWLVWGTQAGKQGVVFASKEVLVGRKELAQKALDFRNLLEKSDDVKQLQQVSHQLYKWLVEPLRAELDANGIQHLVFSLDRSTRYIPMAALFDGQHYLVDRFTISTILTAGLTNIQDKLSPNVEEDPVLGLGLSERVPNFDPLPNVPDELNGIIRSGDTGVYPGLKLLNKDFTTEAFKKLIDYRIVHIATHGQFVPGNPEDSFLVLGNGQSLKIPEIKTMTDLGGVHLVVLSACETAKGGADKDGIEVSGISYYFLTSGAKSVIASLWLVNDVSTSQLMQQFYKNLASGMSKAEALQKAQQSLIKGEGSTVSQTRSDSFKLPTGSSQSPIAHDFSHPYYWAPFILIGNNL